MRRHGWVLPLCVGLLHCSLAAAADDSKEFAALLSRADVVARGFQGDFKVYGGEDRPDAPLDFRTDGLKAESRGRVWVKGDDALVEFLGDPGLTPPGWNGRYKDVVQALAASKNERFNFTAVSSTVTPYANLRVHADDDPRMIRVQINARALDYLNALSTINGLKAESLLADEKTVLKADPTNGHYSISVQRRDGDYSSSLKYDLIVTDQTVKCSSKMTAGRPASSIVVETLAEGDVQGGTIAPRRVARRISGPGVRAAKREVALFTPKDFKPAPFPLTADFFKKYERAYSLMRGDAEAGEFINAPAPKPH